MATDYLDSKMGPKYIVGQLVNIYDKDDGKLVDGIITEVGEETIEIKWSDLPDPTEYERKNISLKGDTIIEH